MASGEPGAIGGSLSGVSAPRRRATYDDVIAAPDHMVAELIDGELYLSPRPAVRHALAASAIGGDLFGRFARPPGSGDAPGGWWILDEPELHFGDDAVVPDLAGWRRERMPTLPDAAAITVPPDWACEVLSPSTVRLDRGPKLRLYARVGVAHLWFVDPVARTIEVYRLEQGCWVVATTIAGDEPVAIAPFPDLLLDVAHWWDTGEAPR